MPIIIYKLTSGIIFRMILFGILGLGAIVMQRNGITYHNYFYILTIYNLIASLLCVFILKNEIGKLVHSLDRMHWSFLFLSIIMFFTLGLLINRLEIPQYIIDRYPYTYIFNFDYRYMITKISDILFQQIFILSLLGFLSINGVKIKEQIIIFSVIFVLIHFVMLIVAGSIAFFHITLSLVASIVFAFFILSYEFGFLYAFIFHLLGYLVFRVLVWIYYLYPNYYY